MSATPAATLAGFLAGALIAALAVWLLARIQARREAAEAPAHEDTPPAASAPPAPTSPPSEAATMPAQRKITTAGADRVYLNGKEIDPSSPPAAEFRRMIEAAGMRPQEEADAIPPALIAENLRRAAGAYIAQLERQVANLQTDLDQAEREAARLHEQYNARTIQALAAGMRIVIDYGPNTRGAKHR